VSADPDPGADDAAEDDRPTDADPATPPAPDHGGLGRQGWVLVVAVVLAVLVVPLTVYLRPGVGGAHYRTAMLVLPMLPAVLLGLVAVWSMHVGR
jgi:hypothetical protein